VQAKCTAKGKTRSVYEQQDRIQPVFGDCELSIEDEEETEACILCGVFTDFFSRIYSPVSNAYQRISLINEQISPHHFTNLPPPNMHVILYL